MPQKQIQKEKSKETSADKQKRADDEQATAEFNDAADKKAAEARERVKELDKKTTTVLNAIDSLLGP